jgi:hypothetical protein
MKVIKLVLILVVAVENGQLPNLESLMSSVRGIVNGGAL